MKPKIFDIHVHLMSEATPADVERYFDRTWTDKAVILSRLPIGKGAEVGRYIEELAELRPAVGDKMFPFASIDPTYEKAPEMLEWAVRKCGIVGMKLLPANFHPGDPRARTLYSLAAELRIPILIHTGILWWEGNNTENCRPGNLDVMWDYPRTRFAMAHIGWPWTDECIALAEKYKVLRGKFEQAFVDITPGTPPSYRENAIARCLENAGPDIMLYGSDAMIPRSDFSVAKWPERLWEADKALLDKLGVSEEQQRKIFYENAERFLKVPDSAD